MAAGMAAAVMVAWARSVRRRRWQWVKEHFHGALLLG